MCQIFYNLATLSLPVLSLSSLPVLSPLCFSLAGAPPPSSTAPAAWLGEAPAARAPSPSSTRLTLRLRATQRRGRGAAKQVPAPGGEPRAQLSGEGPLPRT